MFESILILSPEIFLSAAAMVLLVLDAFLGRKRKAAVIGFALAALFIDFYLVLSVPQGRAFGMLVFDGFSTFFSILSLLGGVLIFLISEKDEELFGRHAGAYGALILLSITGTMFLSSTEDLLMLFIGLELTTVPLFVLAGFLRKDLRSSEGAIKFFLVGTFSTGLMIYGISYLYGLCGSTHFSAIRSWLAVPSGGENHVLFLLSVFFLLVGLCFKLSLVPFHQWTPDTYEGAPTPITAFFSVSREAGVIAVMLRLFGEFIHPSTLGLTELFMALSILSMTVGNLAALRQNNLKRILAYSSIAHAGTIFIGLVAGKQMGREGAMIYSLAYFLMSLGAFAVVIAVSRVKKTDDISAVQGLAKENFGLAILMLFFLLSLSGIPPFLGFWGKWYVFAAAIKEKMFPLVAIGLLNAVVAVYYYFRIVHKMFFQEPSTELPPLSVPIAQFSLQAAAVFSVGFILLFGIFPDKVFSWVKVAAHLLP